MFLEEPRGTVQLADREIAVPALRTRDKGVRNAVDRAYLENTTRPELSKSFFVSAGALLPARGGV